MIERAHTIGRQQVRNKKSHKERERVHALERARVHVYDGGSECHKEDVHAIVRAHAHDRERAYNI